MRANNAAEDSRMQLLVDGTVLEVNRDVTELRTLAARQETLARDLSTAAAKFEALEAALRESEQRLRWSASIIELSDDAIVSINLDGIITSWNRGAARIFGYTADEAIGQPLTIVIPQDRQDEERAILTRTQTGRAYRPFRDGAPKQAGQFDRRFIDSFTCQKCRGENYRSIEDRPGYYCAEAKPRAKRHVGSGSRAPK